MSDELSLSEKCQKYLKERWNYVIELIEDAPDYEPLGGNEVLKENIRCCLTSNTKSYRYVLPTQLLSKTVDHSLDCRSLQAAFESIGSFDARTIAHNVLVPFDKENHNVLGGSNEPYVNNPLRCTSVSETNRARQKNKKDWDRLIHILDTIQNKGDLNFTKTVFDYILFEIHKLLTEVEVVYPTPSRISLEKTLNLIETFIEERSGGDRLEAVTTSLFRTISHKFGLFDEVKREKVNAPDTTSGMVADIECWLNDRIVLLVEVKDKNLNLTQLDAKIDMARASQIKEILFIAQQGIDPKNQEAINKRITQEFTSGQNVYVANLIDFARGILILLGESGRVEFVGRIGQELEASSSSIRHRKTWASLLKEI